MKDFHIRRATIEDQSTLLAFEQAVVEAERPYNALIKSGEVIYYDLDDLLNSSEAYLLVAEIKGRIIGCGYSKIVGSKSSLSHKYHAYLGFMYVTPEYRGCGVNKKITEELLTWSKNQGVSHAYLAVYSQNRAAIKAYEKVGFEACMMEMGLRL